MLPETAGGPEGNVQPLTVGEGRFRGVRVLAVTAADGQAVVGLPLPPQGARARVECVDHIANRVGFFRQLVVARTQALVHLGVRQPRRAQLPLSFREISERILSHIGLIDRDPAGAGEAMRGSGNPFQVAVAWQVKIETGGNLLSLNEHERQLDLSLPCDQWVPQKNVVNRAVVQEFARNRWQARSHDAGLALKPGLPDCSSNSRHIHN